METPKRGIPRQSSVTLKLDWAETPETPEAPAPPIEELAFFPLPADSVGSPSSPLVSALRKRVSITKPIAVELTHDDQKEEDFSSVGSVTSSHFSEMGADEIWEDVPVRPYTRTTACVCVLLLFNDISHFTITY